MCKRIKEFLVDREGRAAAPGGRHSQDELQIAAAALLVEAARLDGKFEAAEESRIAPILEQRFGLDREESQALIAAARTKAEDSVELYSFTRTVSQHFDYDERTAMIEMLWEVVYADGELHDLEANLLRRVAGLLYVTEDRKSTR